MADDKWQRVRKVFDAAVRRRPEERRKFVTDACEGDETLLAEVESLLASLDSAENFMESPAVAAVAGALVGEGSKLKKGHLLGHYKILSELGSGGMGEVYLASDQKLDRHVAIKILNEKFSDDEMSLNRFIREAKAASALNHPNILVVHEVGEAEDAHYIVSEYIKGKTLRDTLRGSQPSARQVLDITIQTANALSAAHEEHLVHRDIKPENIMIRPDGFVKVLDFGLAKLVEQKNKTILGLEDSTARINQTAKGMVLGTVNYMSPEQARGKDVDARSDIWSLGVVLYEMLAGKSPFAGETTSDTISAILTKNPASLPTDIPRELERIASKTLRKNCEERYQNIKDLLIDLKDCKRELELSEGLERGVAPATMQKTSATAVVPPAQSTSSAEYIVGEISRHKRLGLSVLATLLVAAIGLGYWFIAYRYVRQIESVAVLPFVNESGDPDIDYLSDGMTETLIKSLSQVSNLAVKSRSAVFYYKGKETSPMKIGEELGVQAVLLGRVGVRGDDLKLSLELVNTQTQDVIWAEQYDRKQSDLVSLQSEIAKDVSIKLKVKLSGADEAKVAKTSAANPEAYQAYLKGRYYWNRRTVETLKKAIEQFKAATNRDPNYALAYAGLADCYTLLPEYAGTPTSETQPQAKAYAERAIAIDDQLGEAHASLGRVNQRSWKWTESEREFKRAIELSPNYSTAYHWYSILLRGLGRFDEAALMIRKARELDPLSSVISINISEMYQIQNDHYASIENSLKLIELDPDFPTAYGTLGRSYLKLGRTDEAIANFEKAVELGKRDSNSLTDLGYGYAMTGKRTEAITIVNELEERYPKRASSERNIAAVYSGLGDKDKAFEWLEKGFQNKQDSLSNRWVIPFEPLHNDPRFKDLQKRMGLPGF